MKAAINFVRLSCQQTCFIAGKKNIEEEVTCITAKSKYVDTYCTYMLYLCTVTVISECYYSVYDNNQSPDIFQPT